MTSRTTAYNVAVGATVAMGSFTYGFGFASFSTSIGQPGFFEYFNLSLKGSGAAYTNHILGAVNALFFFGAAIGALVGGPMADRIGRKRAIQTAAAISIVGGALVAGSVHVAMLIVVRTIQGCGLGALATITPIYLAEASTPSKRGMLTGLHGFFLVAGYNISAWVGFGCYFSKNLTFQWRGPLALTALPALLLLVGTFWVPESPRWYLMKGRAEEAWTTLSRLHHDARDPNEMGANVEFVQMQRQIEFEQTNPSGYWAILSTPSYRKRAFLACFIQFAAQSSGALVINNYSIIIYTQLGLTGFMPLLMYCIFTLIGATGNLCSLLTIDWTGRRFALITGLSGCLVALILETAMIAEFVTGSHPSDAGKRVAVFAIMLYVFFYGFFLDAASFIYSSEVYPTNIRSRGVALATFTYFVSSITYVTPGATAIASIGWKYFLVFVCLTFISVVVVAFLFPETKGRSLEELAELFGDPVVLHLDDAKAEVEAEKGVVEEVEEVRR
ncbi:general substrate transporter [Halenospora varia]|nr:general substrate transporter [Halenospora varia]